MTLAWPPTLRTDFIVYTKQSAVTHQTLLISLNTFVQVRERASARARAHTHSDILFYFFLLLFMSWSVWMSRPHYRFQGTKTHKTVTKTKHITTN